MKRVVVVLLALALAWLGQSSVQPAFSHGGNYRPPAGEIPPGQKEPHDPQPPPDGPSTPGGDGPQTGPENGPPTDGGGGLPTPKAPGSGQAPGGNSAPPAGPNGAPRTGGSAKPPAARAMDHWVFWWANNKDQILNLKAAVKRRESHVSTRNSAHFFGSGDEKNRSASEAPTLKRIREEVVPALLAVIGNRDVHPDIRGGALIALARCPDAGGNLDVFLENARPEAGTDRLVQESALLALGILQAPDPRVRKFLVEFAEHPKMPVRSRCFAIASLGLLRANDPEVIECLKRRLDGREAVADVPVFAFLALGLIGDAKVLPDLLAWLDEDRIGRHKLTELERAHLVSALGKLGDPDALPAVYALLRRKGTLARRSAWIAMGQLVPRGTQAQKAEYSGRMVRLLPAEGDLTAKNFGLISLGRIAGEPNAPEGVRKSATRFLLETFESGGAVTERPLAALALGLAGFEGESEKPEEYRYALAERIRAKLETLRGDRSALGALAISLGMLGDRRPETLVLLTKILENRGLEKRLRGAAAVALGLIGDESAKKTILETLGQRADRDLRTDVAVAAGLLADPEAEVQLVNVLNDPRVSQFELGSVALALGLIGNRRPISPLLAILQPEAVRGTYPDLTRALVTVALGKIADQRNLRVLSRISQDINYRATVPSLEELLTIL